MNNQKIVHQFLNIKSFIIVESDSLKSLFTKNDFLASLPAGNSRRSFSFIYCYCVVELLEVKLKNCGSLPDWVPWSFELSRVVHTLAIGHSS